MGLQLLSYAFILGKVKMSHTKMFMYHVVYLFCLVFFFFFFFLTNAQEKCTCYFHMF